MFPHSYFRQYFIRFAMDDKRQNNSDDLAANDKFIENDKDAEVDVNADDQATNEKLPAYKALMLNITVEPMLFPYLIASILVLLTNQNLNIQKACRVDLNLSTDVCIGLENKDKNSSNLISSEIMVQKLVADMLIWQTILQNSVPAVLVLFLGSWSDRNRLRRPCMLLPVYGEILRNLGMLVCVFYFDQLPMAVTGLWQSLPIAFTGYWTVIFMAIFSYIGDISSVRISFKLQE